MKQAEIDVQAKIKSLREAAQVGIAAVGRGKFKELQTSRNTGFLGQHLQKDAPPWTDHGDSSCYATAVISYSDFDRTDSNWFPCVGRITNSCIGNCVAW